MKTQYKSLFTPVKIGNVEVKNRYHLSAMGGNDHITDTHGIGDMMKEYYIERAKGGIALLSTGTITIRWHEDRYMVDEQFLTENVDKEVFKLTAEEWIDKLHSFGAKIMIQLSVGTTPCQFPGEFTPTVAVNDIPKADIKKYIERYADAAKLCKDAGFDMIEVHSVHTGYILDQFTTASTNQRTDDYGGSLENRARLGVEIIQAIKGACGEDYPVTLKVGATSTIYDYQPDGSVKFFRRELDETLELLKIWEEAGYDAFNVDAVRNNSVYTPEDTNLEMWKIVKDSVNIPVIAAGSLTNPDISKKMIEEGYCDMISMGRQTLCDPHYVRKLKANKIDDIRFCLRCNDKCIKNQLYGQPVTCAINPTARAEVPNTLTPATEKKTVYVVGGGPGGMEAAITASKRGHDVTLFEKTDELGGLFIAAAAFDFKAPDKKLIAWYKRELAKTDVKVVMNKEVTADFIEENEPDVVIVATGSNEIIIKVPGYDKESVIGVEDACRRRKPIGEKVAIIGGGLSGCELSAQLASEGKQVTVIEMMPKLMANQKRPVAMSTLTLQGLMKSRGVDIKTSAKLKEIKDGFVVAETAEGNIEVAADTVVMAVGAKENDGLYRALEDYAGEVYKIGDCDKFSNIANAIWSGHDLGSLI